MGRFYSWYVVFVLAFIYIFSYVDRQILSLLIPAIQRDLDISDTQISLLHGFAFAFFYASFAIPIARIADVSNRRNLIMAGVFFWSLMTAACGLARNFFQLFIGRVAVGVGEASLVPSAYSLISDYFPAEQRGRATAIFNMGAALGVGLALMIGAAVIRFVAAAPAISLPYFGVLSDWQLTFIIVGLPGILGVLVMLTVREPVRRGVMKQHGNVSVKDVIGHVVENKTIYGPLIIGATMMFFAFQAFLAWTPTYFVRVHGLDLSAAGGQFGTIMLAAGLLGTFGAGLLLDLMTRNGVKNAPLKLAFLASFWSLGFYLTLPFAADASAAAWIIGLALLGPIGIVTIVPVAIQSFAPNEMRAQISALYLFIMNMIGYALGPTGVAIVTDYIFERPESIDLSLSYVCAFVTFVGMLIFIGGLRNGASSKIKPAVDPV